MPATRKEYALPALFRTRPESSPWRRSRLILLVLTVLCGASLPLAARAADLPADDLASTSINEPVTVEVLDNDPRGTAFVEHSNPSHGTVTSAISGALTYRPFANYVGEDTFTYTALAPDGSPAVARVTVETSGLVTNTEARDDTAFPNEDEPVLIYVLGNDAPGPEGGYLTPAVETQPEHGTAEPQADGSILYSPAANWSGEDAFVYSASTGITRDSATVRVTVNSIPDGPDAVDDAAFTNQGATAEIDILVNDSEPEGDEISFQGSTPPMYGTATWHDGTRMITYEPLPDFHGTDQFSYAIADRDGTDTATVIVTVNGVPSATDDAVTVDQDMVTRIDVLANDWDPEQSPLLVTSVTPPQNGSVELDPDGGFLTYSSAPAFEGTDSFTYTNVDDQGNQATAAIHVSVVAGANQAPVAVDDEFLVDEESAGNTLDILSNDHDADANGLTLSIDSTPQHGEVTVDALQQVIYVPMTDFAGQDTFTYSITDGFGGSASATVVIEVRAINDIPVAVPDWAETFEDTSVTINVLANDTDNDGDLLTIASVSDPAMGSATISGTGAIEYTPDANSFGADQLTYVATDGVGGTSETTVDVVVKAVNDVPEPKNDSASTPIDTAVIVPILANDIDADGDVPLTVSIEISPEFGVAAIQADRTVLYTPVKGFEGALTFSYRLWDPYSASAVATVTITVGDPDQAPIGKTDSAETAMNAAVTIDALKNDSDDSDETSRSQR